jgi:hypothetical protein
MSRVLQELSLFKLQIEDTEPQDREGGEHDVVALIHPGLVKRLA